MMRALLVFFAALLLLSFAAHADYRSSSSGGANGTALSTTVPAGTAADDIVVLCANWDSGGSTLTWQAGVTEFRVDTNALDGSRTSYAWRRATGSEGANYTATIDAATDWVLGAVSFSGRHTTNAPDISTASVNDSANASPVTVTANAVTAVAGDDIAWCAGLDVNGAGIANGFTAPTNYTERVDIEHDAGDEWAVLSIATRDNVSGGSTGTVSGTAALTSPAAGWAAAQIRIPAAAGGGGGMVVNPISGRGGAAAPPVVH